MTNESEAALEWIYKIPRLREEGEKKYEQFIEKKGGLCSTIRMGPLDVVAIRSGIAKDERLDVDSRTFTAGHLDKSVDFPRTRPSQTGLLLVLEPNSTDKEL